VWTEHNGASLGGAIAVRDLGIGKGAAQLIDQRLRDRGRAHAHALYGAEIVRQQQLALTQNHGHHRRYGRQLCDTMPCGCLDVPARGELRQQHDGITVAEGRLAHGETVHMVKRRRDENAVAVRAWPAQALAHHPQVRVVRQHHTLRAAGRARRIEEHRWLLAPHRQRAEGVGVTARCE
jgi:hypothetical protein